jgi:cell volume regulation protein A
VLYVIKGHEYDYMLTLATLFLLYSGTEFMRGSGAIAVLIFGIMLGNAQQVGGIFKMTKVSDFSHRMREFQHEITFFVKSFFFVYLGLLINVSSLSTIFFGVFILIEIILARVAAVYLSFLNQKMDNKFLIYVMMPRGLAAAVLSSLPVTYGIAHGAQFPDFIFMVIIGTAVVASAGTYYFESKIKPQQDKEKAKIVKQKETNGKQKNPKSSKKSA